ncbi:MULTISPECIES: hypothetical protein [unclassified Streptomyces]|uniref:hypothetical protein n=1 Tax=unclassified Streptomyces TaxID=2593676 RepID=UPI000DD9F107|nr:MULTISPECIES: hypothetical protein [unclassified Streptomyces]QZZ26503.1 hypothetical protein A7X85_09775 [Streptomyces sp. ST1015]
MVRRDTSEPATASEVAALGVIALLGGATTWQKPEGDDPLRSAGVLAYPGGAIESGTLRRLCEAGLLTVAHRFSAGDTAHWKVTLTPQGRELLPDLPALAPVLQSSIRHEEIKKPALGRDLTLVLRCWHTARESWPTPFDPRLPALLRALRDAGWSRPPLAQALGRTRERIGQMMDSRQDLVYRPDELPPVPSGKPSKRVTLTDEEAGELARLDEAVRQAPDDLALRAQMWEHVAAVSQRGSLEASIAALLGLDRSEVGVILTAMGMAREVEDFAALIDPAWAHWLKRLPHPDQVAQEQKRQRLAEEADGKRYLDALLANRMRKLETKNLRAREPFPGDSGVRWWVECKHCGRPWRMKEDDLRACPHRGTGDEGAPPPLAKKERAPRKPSLKDVLRLSGTQALHLSWTASAPSGDTPCFASVIMRDWWDQAAPEARERLIAEQRDHFVANLAEQGVAVDPAGVTYTM